MQSSEAHFRTRRIEIPIGYMKEMVGRIFDELSAGVEDSYREITGLGQPRSIVSMYAPTSMPLLPGGIRGSSKEIVHRTVLPFGVVETGEAWWQDWHNYSGQSLRGSADNTVVERYGLEICDLKTNTFYAQQILRRHVEKHRVVYAWNAYIEPFSFKGKRVSGIYYLEQSNVLIKPENQESLDNEALSLMLSREVITPHFLDLKLKDDPKMTAVTSFLLSSMSPYTKARSEMVESMLVDKVLQKRQRTIET
ncbi:unnamed protein product [Phytophthora lilii]|uniref:Unnamed protein product n=1 Tax=Phytophthora lilii TaxID=2077276 RepID=A0A9W6TN95_9STRA|nr:unnamed protein product [Phytophthora lilii]